MTTKHYVVKVTRTAEPKEAEFVWQTGKALCLAVDGMWLKYGSGTLLTFDRSTSKQVAGAAFFYCIN